MCIYILDFVEDGVIDAFAFAQLTNAKLPIRSADQRNDLKNLYDAYKVVYTEHEATLRRVTPAKFKKFIGQSTDREPNLWGLFEFAKRHFYDDVKADPLYRNPYNYQTASYLLAVIGKCLGELKKLIETDSIEQAVMLTVDPNTYFLRAGQ
jgi:hypothetical protein